MLIAGLDEVGRGPLAGPVVACAVILPDDLSCLPSGITDSKALSSKKRESLAPMLMSLCHYGLGEASVDEIDEINILQATFLAMRRAVAALPCVPEHIMVDGNRVPPNLPCPATAIIEGDAKVLAIGAASIIAKVTRDALMADLAKIHPGYGWERNAGYGTKTHMDGLHRLGITPHHRRSFAPVTRLLSPDDRDARRVSAAHDKSVQSA